jgi:hypothetical protein
MFLDKNILTAGILFVGLYIFAVQSLATALATVGLSIILFVVTKSEGLVLAFMLATLFLKQFNVMFKNPEPVGIEAFQTKDAPSIHARLEQVRTPAPLAPKAPSITGVLESPDILNNMPLQAMDTLTKEGVPCTSIPASAKARVLIYPPSEDSVPALKESLNMLPKDNPYLQTGQDRLAEEVAHAQRGTDLYAPDSGALDGVAAGAGPV